MAAVLAIRVILFSAMAGGGEINDIINHESIIDQLHDVIEDYAFEGTTIKAIVFPDSISYIGNDAFPIEGLISIENPSCNPETNPDLFIGYYALGLTISLLPDSS